VLSACIMNPESCCGKNKKWLDMYIHYIFYNCVIISLYSCCGTWTYLSYWCVAGADANWSTSSPCSQFSDYVASSVDGTVYRRLHTLPMVTVWLGCPRFGCLALDFRVCTITHTVTSNYRKHSGQAIPEHIHLITSI
jgi:hypothetical protein